jgi:hypothetical protein
MQAFVVRPLIVGLLALIVAGLWAAPDAVRSLAGGQPGCHAGQPSPATAVGAMMRRGIRC